MTVVADEESRLAGAADPPGSAVASLRVRCAEAVFPVAPEPNLRPRAVLGYAVGFLAAMAYPLLFPLGRVHFSHLWAEDGQIFLGGAANDSFPRVLFQPYAGYLHVLPRLIAEVVTVLPVGWWAAAVCLAAAAVRAALALTVFIASAGHSRNPAVRLLLAAAIVVLPVGNLETINNLANLHWYIPIAALWLLLSRPRTRVGNVLVAVALFLLVLSSPLSLLLVPIALLRFVLDRRRDLWPSIGVLAATAIQAVAIAHETRQRFPVDVPQAVATAEARVPLVTFTGPELALHVRHWALSLTSVVYSWPGLLATMIALAIAARAVVRGGTLRRAATALCLGYAVATIGLNLFMNWGVGWMRIDQPDYVIQGQRYGVTACYFLFSALVFGLDRYPHGQPRRWRQVGAGTARIAVASLMIAGVVLQWNVDGEVGSGGITLRQWVSSGPTWSEAVNTARQRCNNGAGGVEIPIDPDGWMTRMPCDRLRTG
jgi:hypothetical protein